MLLPHTWKFIVLKVEFLVCWCVPAYEHTFVMSAKWLLLFCFVLSSSLLLLFSSSTSSCIAFLVAKHRRRRLRRKHQMNSKGSSFAAAVIDIRFETIINVGTYTHTQHNKLLEKTRRSHIATTNPPFLNIVFASSFQKDSIARNLIKGKYLRTNYL